MILVFQSVVNHHVKELLSNTTIPTVIELYEVLVGSLK